ncbi:MAG: hypothetical protein CL840_02605 [Crocinitomicaceae bacterium]|nr:hypothetical protein [Crocinitomicaceae bacterium]
MVSNAEKTQWSLIWSLIALNTAIIISWIAYHNYQPILLDRFGLHELAPLLGYSKLLVMATVPPLAGYLADRIKSKGNRSLPILTAGVGITALIFMTVAATIAPESILPLQGLLPVMIVVWLISMNLFYAPALATLEEFVPVAQFTTVMGVYILASDMAFALEPAIILLVDFLGASLTFVTGGLLITVAGFMFHRNYLKRGQVDKSANEVSNNPSSFHLVILFGLALGFVFAYLINVLPVILEFKLEGISGDMPMELVISVILALTALFAFFIARRLNQYNKSRLFILSFFCCLFSLLGVYLLPNVFSLIMLLVLIPSLAILSVTGFPLAISNASVNDKMFAAGLFVAGMEIPDSLLEIVIG